MASSIVSYICGIMLFIQRMSDETYFCGTLQFDKIVLSSKYGNYEKMLSNNILEYNYSCKRSFVETSNIHLSIHVMYLIRISLCMDHKV